MKIREVAEEFGVTIKTIREWEQSGIINSVRTIGGHRRYENEYIQELKAKRPDLIRKDEILSVMLENQDLFDKLQEKYYQNKVPNWKWNLKDLTKAFWNIFRIKDIISVQPMLHPIEYKKFSDKPIDQIDENSFKFDNKAYEQPNLFQSAKFKFDEQKIKDGYVVIEAKSMKISKYHTANFDLVDLHQSEEMKKVAINNMVQEAYKNVEKHIVKGMYQQGNKSSSSVEEMLDRTDRNFIITNSKHLEKLGINENTKFIKGKKVYINDCIEGMIFGYRGKSNLNRCLMYCPYIPFADTPVVLDPESFCPSKGLITRMGLKMNPNIKKYLDVIES